MNVDPYLDLKYEKREKVKEKSDKEQEAFGASIFKAISKVYQQQFPDPLTITPVQKFPNLQEEGTNTAVEGEIKNLDKEILKGSSDSLKILAIKQDIDAGKGGIRELWEATRIYMPKTHKFLEDYTDSEFKRVILVHKMIGHWLEFPTIAELERGEEPKRYFKTYLHLLEDRGTEQDKHLHHFPLKAFKAMDEDEKIPDVLQRVLDKDSEEEVYRDHLTEDTGIQTGIQTLEMSISGELPASGAIAMDNVTLEMQVFDGTKWNKIGP